MAFSLGTTAVSASSVSTNNSQNEVAYVIVTKDGYADVTKKQFDEIIESNDSQAIIQKYNLQLASNTLKSHSTITNDKTNKVNTSETINIQSSSYRLWNITSNTIKAGKTTNYYKEDGSPFDLTENQDLVVRVKTPGFTSVSMDIGIDGSNSVELTEDVGSVTIGFLDNPAGDYVVYVKNNSSKDVEISGSIEAWDNW